MKKLISQTLILLLAAIAFTVSGPVAAFAQFSSAIEGTVTDNTGALVPGAKVVLTNEATGVANNGVSNSAGVFRFSALGTGMYKVTASLPGFASVSLEHINLTAGAVRDASIQLPAASVTTEVQVDAAPSAVETDEATISSVTTALEVAELPIESRNIYGVTNQTPGVTGSGLMGQTSANTDIFYATTTPAIVANGAPNHSNTYLLDGVSLDDSPSGGDAKLVPNPDSVQEVVVSTTNYSAEFGKAASLVTQITSKGGTNQFHGSGFEQYQASDLTARTYFQNSKDPNGNYITPYHRNEFGGSFGGPVRKDKTFLFGSYDQVISSTSSASVVQVEDPAFLQYLTANYPNNLSTQLLTAYKPTVSATPNSVQTVGQYSQANISKTICASGSPNELGPDGFPCSLPAIDSVVGTTVGIHNGYQFSVRGDQSFRNSKDRVYTNFYKTHLLGPFVTSVRPTFDVNFPQDAYFAAINYTHVFTPSILNETAYGYTRTSVNIPCNLCQLLPVNITGISTGFGDGFAPVGFAQNDFHWREMLSVIHGKHAIKTGFEFFHNQDYAPFTVPDNRGQSWNFDNLFDFGIDQVDEYNGISFDPKTGGVANNNRYFLDSTYGAYVQDDWKLSPDLTLNLGVRWDAISNPSESHGTLSTLTLGSGSTLLQQIAGTSVGLNPDPGKRRPFLDHKKTYFAPRFGFAYRPFGLKDWSVRGGAGIFFDRGGNTNWSDTETGNPPVDYNTSANIHNPATPAPPAFALCQSAVFPYNCPLPATLLASLPPLNPRGGFGTSSNIGGPDPHLKMAYIETMFLGVQHSFKGNWLAEADFVHSASKHEYSITNVNRVDGINTVVFVPGTPAMGTTPATNDHYTETIGPLPNPYFGNISYASNAGGSNYNGFTAVVRKDFAKGYSFQVAYTVQKTIDLISTTPGQQKGAENSVVIDAYNVAAQRGLSSQDTPKQLSFNGLWEIPAPSFDNRFLKGAVKGWQVSGLGTLLSGFPATVFTSVPYNDFNLDGQNYDLPNVPKFGATLKGLKRSQYIKGVFQASDFPLPVKADGTPLGVEGSLGRNTYRGPGFAQTDASISKNTPIPFFFGEPGRLQFRLDVYNLFNRVNVGGWDTNLADGNFGKITNTSQARTLQLSTKFTF
jgi:hypothetical protein